MKPDFFAQGEIQVFVKPRWYNQFEMLGTAITSPRLRTQYAYRNVLSERSGPAPHNKAILAEQHIVAMVLNRINHRMLNRIKDVGRAGSTGSDWVRVIDSGRLVMGSSDFELFFRYALPNTLASDLAEAPTVPPPDGASKGRLYYSAALLECEEDSPSRVQEVALLVECNSYPKDKKLTLFSERETDFPSVTVE